MDDAPDTAVSQTTDDAPRGALSGTLLAALGAVIPPGAEVRWSGPAQLRVKPKGKSALAVTTAGIAIAIERGDEVESRFVAGREIRWVGAGRVKARLSLADGERLDVKVRDASFFTALLGMSRRDVPPAPAPDAPEPAAVPQPAPQPADVVPFPDRRAATQADRLSAQAAEAGRVRCVACVVTPFTPSAYLEHADGVLRPAAWPDGAGPAPEVGTRVVLEFGQDRWTVVSLASGSQPVMTS